MGNWTVDDANQLTRLGSVNTPGTALVDITAAHAGYRRVAVYSKAASAATLATFDIAGQRRGRRPVLLTSLTDSAPLTGASLTTGGSGRLFLVGKSGTDVLVRSYLVTNGITDFDQATYQAYGSSTAAMAATVLKSSRLITVGVRVRQRHPAVELVARLSRHARARRVADQRNPDADFAGPPSAR